MKSWQRTAVLILFLGLALGPQKCNAADLLSTLSPAAREVAKDIGITPYILQLQELRDKSPSDEAKKRDPHFLYVKQEMTEILLTTFLETRDVISDVDDEMTISGELKNVLESHRDKAIRLNNITNFVSGGAFAMIGSGVQVGTTTPYQNAGNILEVAAGAISTGISTYALKQSSGEKRSSSIDPNMLARFFCLSTTKDKDIPAPVWNFLNEPIPGGTGLSRRDILIQRWVQIKRIPPPKSKEGQRRIALLSGTVAQTHQVSIDMLDNRVAMLNDLRAAIGLMSRELLEIMRLMRKL
jgi:hypothetical protein